jgi:hypothetical protein
MIFAEKNEPKEGTSRFFRFRVPHEWWVKSGDLSEIVENRGYRIAKTA